MAASILNPTYVPPTPGVIPGAAIQQKGGGTILPTDPQYASMVSSSGGAGGAPASFTYSNSLPGIAPTAYDPAYGGIPGVPNPTFTQSEAIGGNLANLSQLYQLAGGLNDFNAGQALRQYQLNMPGFDALRGKQSDVIGQELAGEIPDDVLNLIGTNAAERGVAGGQPGSPNANAAYLRSLGLTSIGQEQAGMSNLDRAIRQTPTAPLFNTASMMVTPDQMQNAEMAASLYRAAPQPKAAADAALKAGQSGVIAGGGGPTIGGVTPGGGGGNVRSPQPLPFDTSSTVYGGPGTATGPVNFQYPTTTTTRTGGLSGGVPFQPDKNLMFGQPWGDPLQPQGGEPSTTDAATDQAYQEFLDEMGMDDTESAWQDFVDQFGGGSGPDSGLPDIYSTDFSAGLNEDDIWASLGV